ncbi:MAG: fibronectin type III domain-containing protein [Bacteroidetes bacterium]|nr:fibronectin type III domain-containing protein [Bacteroidota bacterium]
MPRENLTNGVNPFRLGTYRYARSDTANLAQAVWIPDIAETGDYAVYVAYASLPDATSDASYTVHHLGGTTSFSVDQRMGGGTWIYLGTFRFLVGIHPETGQVTLTNRSRTPGKSVSADAVRFGGGMGNIVRGRSTSGRPRFTEGARYYMQYAGMPDRLVYNVTESLDDYVDDYRGRAEWVNYLKGAPSGPNKERQNPGMGIPIDLSLAFHTDAGVTKSDSTIGTLMIYSSEGADTLRVFPDGMSRFANRDLGDLMQTQIVSDIRALYDPAWSRRSIWDRDYSEAVRPNVPGVLLELLSHQNFADMKFALDPRFRFDVSRAIYKAMLRFIASQNDTDYVVAPLPVTHILAEFNGETSLRLRWRSRSDPIEPTADPTGFIVYTRRGSGAFDNGVYASSASYEMDHLEPGITFSFRVTAVNDGGESFPSEVVSAGWMHRDRSPVLVVNGFDRISAPGTIEEGSWRGFAGFVDEGVPDGYDASYVGEQYDYEMDSPWLDDDAPGHGASHSTFETRILAGNTFDFAAVHGEAIMSCGRSFVSASDEAVAGGMIELQGYDTLDLILGEEKTTFGPGAARPLAFRTFSIEMQEILRSYTDRGGRLFVSGAYVGTDLNGPWSREEDRLFSKDVLHLKWRTDHASLGGRIVAPNDVLLPYGSTIDYNTERTGSVYRVESPDAIEPVGEDGETLLRYADNLMSAAIGVRGTHRVVVFGFPFETITTARERALTMRAILNYLDSE